MAIARTSIALEAEPAARRLGPRRLKTLLGVAVMVACALVWEALSRLGLVNAILLPAPTLGAYFPILLNTVSGVKGIDKRLIHFAKTLGASERVVMLEIVPPAALPSILTGMRVGLGVGWMVVVAAEMIAASSGLGYMIMDG